MFELSTCKISIIQTKTLSTKKGYNPNGRMEHARSNPKCSFKRLLGSKPLCLPFSCLIIL